VSSLAAKERFGDLPNFVLDSPAFAPSKLGSKEFTSDTEMTQFIQRRIAPSPTVSWRRLGKTQGGRDLHLLVLTQDGRSDPLSVAASRKPNVWVIAQQHGNEPAGAEAALELLRRLVYTDLKQVLERVNVMVMPRANPDGAAAKTRHTASDKDMNRDHMALAVNETNKLHAALLDYPPSVVVDAHEFTVGERWVERYGVMQASDVLVQSASHTGVAEGLKRLAKDVFDPALQAAWQPYGLKSFVYHTLNTVTAPSAALSAANAANPPATTQAALAAGAVSSTSSSFVQMGGNFSGIGRNAMGLMGAVSYLIETRGVGMGKEHFPRRVAAHVISMSTILRTTAANVDAIRNAQREARRHPSTGVDWVVDHSTAKETKSMPMLDPATGEDKTIAVEFQNSLLVTPTVSRSLPAAYVLAPSYGTVAVVSKLQALGLAVNRLAAAQELELESYTVTQIKLEAGEFGAPVNRYVSETKRMKKTVEAGSVWVPVTQGYQPNWRIAAVLFEPESLGNLYASKLLNGEPTLGQTLAVLRVVGGALVTAPQFEPQD
jgi:Zinc carboxypeptidase